MKHSRIDLDLNRLKKLKYTSENIKGTCDIFHRYMRRTKNIHVLETVLSTKSPERDTERFGVSLSR
jgi:hypothetical protein